MIEQQRRGATVSLPTNAAAPVPSFGITAAFLGGASTTIAAKQSAAPDDLRY
jgi:hypothetical protein